MSETNDDGWPPVTAWSRTGKRNGVETRNRSVFMIARQKTYASADNGVWIHCDLPTINVQLPRPLLKLISCNQEMI
jgi:hypothetical protein